MSDTRPSTFLPALRELTLSRIPLKWLQGGTQCGEAEVLVEDLKLRLEETGVIGPCG